MFALATVSSAAPYGAWAYVAVFALMTLAFAGIPGIGTAVVGWAAVLASQGKLNIVAVLAVAATGAEVGGLAGYSIGDRWGRKLVDRPGRRQAQWQKAVARAEAIYAKWGRLAVFFMLADLRHCQNEVLPVRGLEVCLRCRVRAVGRARRLRRGQGLGRRERTGAAWAHWWLGWPSQPGSLCSRRGITAAASKTRPADAGGRQRGRGRRGIALTPAGAGHAARRPLGMDAPDG